MLNKRPIGIFDSGVGGLSVVKKVLELLPRAKITYLGDTARVPYGGRPAEELVEFADQITKFLIQQDCGIIIDACNSTSAVALDYLQRKYSNPIVGVIAPGIRAALKASKTGRIGLIGTEATIKSRAHQKLALRIDQGIKILPLACPKFVPLVEAGRVKGSKTEDIIRTTLEPLMLQGIDTLILGCTHYPFLADVIESVMGKGVTLVDPAIETAKEVKRLFAGEQVTKKPNESVYYATGEPKSFKAIGEMLTGAELKNVKKVILCEKLG